MDDWLNASSISKPIMTALSIATLTSAAWSAPANNGVSNTKSPKSFSPVKKTSDAITTSPKAIDSAKGAGKPSEVVEVPIKSSPEAEELKKRLANKIRFCDEPILNTAVEHEVQAWTIDEKRIVTEAFEQSCCLAPGLVARSLVFSPITVYRASEKMNRVAQSYPPFVNGTCNELVFANRFFDEHATVEVFHKKYPLRLWTMIHELTHMADPGHKLSSSPEWLKLLPRVLGSQSLALRIGEGSDSVCWGIGVPSKYAGKNEREALAEYCTAMLLVQNKPKMDNDVEAYIISNLLTDKAKADESLPYAYKGWCSLRKLKADSKDLNEAIKYFEKALAIDPSYLHAKYGKDLAEMRLHEAESHN